MRLGGNKQAFYFFHCRLVVSDAAAKQHLIENIDSPLLYPIVRISKKLVNPIEHAFIANNCEKSDRRSAVFAVGV